MSSTLLGVEAKNDIVVEVRLTSNNMVLFAELTPQGDTIREAVLVTPKFLKEVAALVSQKMPNWTEQGFPKIVLRADTNRVEIFGDLIVHGDVISDKPVERTEDWDELQSLEG